jgi:hypothetical protein
MEERQGRDGRMVSGPAIAGSMWFEVSEPMITTVGGELPARRLELSHDLKAASEITLESTGSSLAALEGSLSIGRRWDDRDTRLGFLRRDGSNYYTIAVGMDEAEWQRALELLSWGFRPRMLELQFDVEYEQHFDGEAYWDDVRYPSAIFERYSLDWTPAGTPELRSRHYRG